MSQTYVELTSQYDALAKTAALLDEKKESLAAWLKEVKPSSIVFIGCGSSFSMAQAFAANFSMALPYPTRALAGGDLLVHAARYAKSLEGALLVSISRSGSTSEVVKSVEVLRSLGCNFTVLSISCVVDAPIDRLADQVIDMPWAFDASVCQTRTVSCLYFVGAYLAALLCGCEKTAESLRSVIERGPAFLQRIEPTVKELAKVDFNAVVTLGDAEIGGACEEGALAFKEICQIPSNYYHFLDARHGPMVLFGKKTMILVAVSDAENALELGMLRDLAAKTSTVVAVSAKPIAVDGVQSISWGEELAFPALALPFLLLCQLLSYYKSFETGANPDAPDGLEAWIKL